MFRAAVFDMDGLLLDSERVIMRAWLESASEVGVAIPRRRYLAIIGQAAQQADARLAELVGGDAVFREVREKVVTKLAVERPFPAKAGAEALLANLSRVGIPCAVASSTEIAEVERRLLSSGLRGYFLAIAGGDEVRRGKPDPSVYLLAAQRLGCSPAECLAFEDSSNGIKAAQAAGMAVVAVPDLVTPDTDLAFEVLSSLEHAQTHLKRWFQ